MKNDQNKRAEIQGGLINELIFKTEYILLSLHFYALFVLVSVTTSNSYAYDRSQVARYADKWVDHSEQSELRNPFFHNYSSDCANYISQCIIARGIDLSTDPNCDSRHAIPDCDNLDYNLEWTQSADKTTIVYPDGSPPSGLETGDVIIFGDLTGDYYKHAAIVVGGTGSSCICNTHTNDRYHRNWNWAWGTGTGQWKRATFYEIPDNAGGQANLTPYTPPGWEAPLIASSVSGTHTSGPDFVAGEPTYIDWAIQNNGSADLPDTVYYALYVDDFEVQTWYSDGLWYGYYSYIEDYEYTFSEGWHYLK